MKVTNDNKQQILESYINSIIDNMKLEDLVDYVWEDMYEKMNRSSNKDIEDVVSTVFPDILENV